MTEEGRAAGEVDVAPVFVAAPGSLEPALREVEGLVDAAGDLELPLGAEDLHGRGSPEWVGVAERRAQSSSGNMMVITASPESPAPIATMGKCLRGGRLLSRRSLRMSRTSTHILTRSPPDARRA